MDPEQEAVKQAVLHQASTYFSKGRKNLELGEFDDAVENFSHGLELKGQCMDEQDIQMAESYYYYGLALLRKWCADNKAAIVADVVDKADADQAQQGQSSAAAPAPQPPPDRNLASDDTGKGKGVASAPVALPAEPSDTAPETAAADGGNGAEKGGEDGDEGGENEEENDGDNEPENDGDDEGQDGGEVQGGPDGEEDAELAWEMLELARVVYSKDTMKYARQLADVHEALGELSGEREQFHESIQDYATAANLLEMLDQSDVAVMRARASALFQVSLAQLLAKEPTQALENATVAQQLLLSEKAELESRLQAGLEGDEAQKARDRLVDLQSILTDIEAHIEEVQQANTLHQGTLDEIRTQLRNSIRSVLLGTKAADAAGQSSAEAAFPAQSGTDAESVQTLGVVGRGKKRIQIVPVATSGQEPKGNLIKEDKGVGQEGFQSMAQAEFKRQKQQGDDVTIGPAEGHGKQIVENGGSQGKKAVEESKAQSKG